MAVQTITTIMVPAPAGARQGAYDLTTLAIVKDELSLASTDTANDAFLSRAITQASSAIHNYTNRVFPIEALQDEIFIQQDPYPWQVPGGVYPLQLSRWPLANSAVVTFTGTTHSTKTVDGIPSTAGLKQGTLVFAVDGSLPAGTAIQSVGLGSITLTQAATSSEVGLSLTTGLQVVQRLSATQTQTLICGTNFTIDAKNGWLIRLNSFTGIGERWEAEPVTVQYQAGYATIPADLVDACLRLVTARFSARGRDPMLVQQDQPQGVGTQRFWVGPTPGQSGVFAPEILSLIESYRVPVTG